MKKRDIVDAANCLCGDPERLAGFWWCCHGETVQVQVGELKYYHQYRKETTVRSAGGEWKGQRSYGGFVNGEILVSTSGGG
jgi:hypothetical protein